MARINRNRGKIIIASVAVVAVMGVLLAVKFMTPAKVSSDCTDMTHHAAVTLNYTAQQEFSPKCVMVTSGTKITYTNQSAAELQVGADPHPIHSGNREVSNGGFILSVKPSESASSTMTKVGTFGLHDHINEASNAVIQVQP